MTNAERIRTMTEEGLAEFLSVSFIELLNTVVEDGGLSRHENRIRIPVIFA